MESPKTVALAGSEISYAERAASGVAPAADKPTLLLENKHWPTMESPKTVALAGSEISYAERAASGVAPAADKPTLLLIHGWGDSCKTWSRVLENLSYDGRIVAMTLRGWGDSAKEGLYSVAAYAADVVAFMDAVGIGKAILGGHSMGTLVSTYVAVALADDPGRICGCILAGGMATMDPRTDVVGDGTTLGALNDIFKAWPDAVGADEKAFLEGFQLDDLKPYIDDGKVPPAFAEQVMEETLKAAADTRSYKDCWADMIAQDHSDDLHRIVAPVCIIWGTNDAVCPKASQELLQAKLAGAAKVAFQEFKDAPHGVIWTHAAESAAAIDAFLASHT